MGKLILTEDKYIELSRTHWSLNCHKQSFHAHARQILPRIFSGKSKELYGIKVKQMTWLESQ